MKQNKLFIIPISIVLIVLILIFLGNYFLNSQNKFKLDSDNKYQIITDVRYKTMRNDGGSHTDIYYEIDLDSSTVTKIKDDYYANIGSKSKIEKNILYTKEIDSNMKKQVKSLIDEVTKKEYSRDENRYNYYTILGLNLKKDIYNSDTIIKIEGVLQKLDKY